VRKRAKALTPPLGNKYEKLVDPTIPTRADIVMNQPDNPSRPIAAMLAKQESKSPSSNVLNREPRINLREGRSSRIEDLLSLCHR
jgi:hypothetical protein